MTLGDDRAPTALNSYPRALVASRGWLDLRRVNADLVGVAQDVRELDWVHAAGKLVRRGLAQEMRLHALAMPATSPTLMA